MNPQQILELIRINERQRDVAKQRGECDVVAYHQRAIDALYQQIKASNASSAVGSAMHGFSWEK